MSIRALATGHALGSRELALLVAVDQAGSIRGAAARLGLTPAAVSKAVRQAEARLGGAVFERDSAGARPTPAGRVLLDAGLEALDALRRAEAQFRASDAPLSGTVRIGCGPIPASDVARILIPEAKRRWPALRLALELGAAHELIAAIVRQDLDCAICHLEDVVLPRGFEGRLLQRLHAVAMVRADHPLAGRGRLDPAVLAPYALAGFTPYARFIAWYRERVGVEPDFALIGPDYDLLADAAARSDLLLFTASHLAPELARRHDLVTLDIATDPFRHLVHVIVPAAAATPATRAVVALAQELIARTEA